MRRLDALIVLDDVFVLEELHHFDFVVQELAEKFVGNVIFRHDFDGDLRLVAVGVSELKRHVRDVEASLIGRLGKLCKSASKQNYLHFRVASVADFLDDLEAVTFEERLGSCRLRDFTAGFGFFEKRLGFRLFSCWRASFRES